MNDDNIIKLPEKKQSVRPADPVLIQPAEPPKAANDDEVFQPYKDGVLFKCSPRNMSTDPEGPAIPDPSGKFVIHDGGGQCVALAKNQRIANLFCAALHVYFQAAQHHAQAEANDGATPGQPMPASVAKALTKERKGKK